MATSSSQCFAFRLLRFQSAARRSTGLHYTYSVLTSSFSSKPSEDEQFMSQVIEPDVDDEDLIRKMRDVSGLKGNLLKRIHNKVPEILSDYQRQPSYQRRLFAKFGSESNVDPRTCWPSREALREFIQLENEWEPPLQVRMTKVEGRQQAKDKRLTDRRTRIYENMEKMDTWVKEYADKRVGWLKQKKTLKEKKDNQLKEAHDYFGYHVDRKDPKFKEMMEENEKREKKISKQKKIDDKLEKFKSKLQTMADELK